MSNKKNNLKENPLMNDKKNLKKIKGGLGVTKSEDDNEIKKFIIIVVVLGIIVALVYGLTLLINNKESDYVYTPQSGKINYDTVSVGTILNRPYDEYYVLIYDQNNTKVSEYATTLAMYMDSSDEKEYIKIYYCDLGNELNSSYYNVGDDNKSNPKATKVSEFDFGEITLLHIKNGKITEYIENYTTIQEKLK